MEFHTCCFYFRVERNWVVLGGGGCAKRRLQEHRCVWERGHLPSALFCWPSNLCKPFLKICRPLRTPPGRSGGDRRKGKPRKLGGRPLDRSGTMGPLGGGGLYLAFFAFLLLLPASFMQSLVVEGSQDPPSPPPKKNTPKCGFWLGCSWTAETAEKGGGKLLKVQESLLLGSPFFKMMPFQCLSNPPHPRCVGRSLLI